MSPIVPARRPTPAEWVLILIALAQLGVEGAHLLLVVRGH